jgi:rare lipoprotein A
MMHIRLVLIILISVIEYGRSYSQTFKQTGVASYYADKFVGRTTANGEKYKHNKLTAAHKTLPFGTILKVKNLENGKEVTVRVNDRGPFVEGRIIDLSKSAAQELNFINQGIAEVEIVSIANPDESKKTYSSLDRQIDDNKIAVNSYYSLAVNQQKLSGFGVQIGSYRELVNLVQLADELRRTYNERIYVQVSVIQDVKYYKIILGKLKSREKAEKVRDKIIKDHPDSFVIKY